MIMEEDYEKPGLIEKQLVETATFVELDDVTMAVIRRMVKEQVVRESHFLVSLGACLLVTLVSTLTSLSYYVSGNYLLSQSLWLPAMAGICGMIILTYAYQRM